MKKTLLLRPGSVHPEIRSIHGDFDEWFVRASGLGAENFDVFDPTLEERPPGDPESYRSVLVTGSLAAAYGDEPWIAETERLIRRFAEDEIPLLGVCFGAQIIATALGGRVVRNPRGQEVGTVGIELTPAGLRSPFLEGLPATFPVQSSHDDCVERLPDGAELLASNASSEVQAYRVGPSIHAVQFHPEILPETMRDMIRYQVGSGDLTPAEGQELERKVGPTPEARSLLARFFSDHP